MSDSDEIKSKTRDVEHFNLKPKKRCNSFVKWIDKDMIPVKISYILFYASLGAWSPFTVLFLTSLDLNPLQADTILAVTAVVSTIATPFWAFFSDLTGINYLYSTYIGRSSKWLVKVNSTSN